MRLLFLLSFFLLLNGCKNQNVMPKAPHKYTNALIHESSPYLLQHAHNPVDWQPWGEAALEKAKKENKLLIISIGYAACHWCHVMEHESFEDSTVAALMNEHFVPIKVDREERPDVDDVYMSAAQLLTGSGGWPLNAFAMPDGRPVWAGTYFPKERWIDILQRFAELKETDYDRLEQSATKLTQGVADLDAIEIVQEKQDYTEDLLKKISLQFVSQVDMKDGGRRGAPKFPMPNNWEYLLKYADVTGDKHALNAVLTTLDKMARGGIYDQMGGGFARYSVDGVWKVPHFEKMLYDNGQLISLYAQAYQMTKNPLYKHTIEQTLDFVDRELSAPDGGFYSSLDADSEGVEGKYYVWTAEEIAKYITDEKQLAAYKDYYTITDEGNWEHSNILHITDEITAISRRHGMGPKALLQLINEINAMLLPIREKRIRPGLDDKILTSWNGLMIKGYVDAYKAMGMKKHLDIAIKNAHYILQKQMSDDNRLNRNLKDGKSSINGFLDDYAAMIHACLALYEVTFDESWFNVATDMTDYVHTHFYDTQTGMYHYTSDIDPPLVARKKELTDNVIPASNSMMARALARLGEITYNEGYITIAKQMLQNMMPTIIQTKSPSFYSNWLQLLFDQVHEPYEVVIMGPNAIALAHQMMRTYHRNSIFLGDVQESRLPLLKNKYVDGNDMIYVCRAKACKLPVKDVEEALELMK